ncbi:MAG TPA: sigma-70 family RNA polymerase sigma factor, partial [Kofleriaceae bacterium]|nr:sigma-70 family RNA polymerase sigma factor [Kofleriaceae bacterium]
MAATDATRAAIEQVWKAEAARVIGGLARLTRDVALAEDLAHDALVLALEHWPATGIPDNPGAWLVTTARNRGLNALRRARTGDRAGDALAHLVDHDRPRAELEAALEARMDHDVADDVLRLLFAACHPALAPDAQVTLTLRLVGGLTTAEIARAYLTSEATVAQRVVRAKRTLALARVPFEVPRGDELGARLASVLHVVYLVFNEGYTASGGDQLLRPALSDEALRLAALLATLAPAEPEVHGLVALLHLQASRAAARVDDAGEPVL